MDKSTLSNYGWIVIAVLVLAVMIALATPFGTYIQAGVESTTQGLFDTSEKAMNVVGMSAGEGNFEDGYQGVGNSGEHETVEGSVTFAGYYDEDYNYIEEPPVTLTWEELKAGKDADKYGYNASAITNTQIGNDAFMECAITSITIPNTITTIGDSAFMDCFELTNITLPDSITTIEDWAFYSTGLTTITIPDGVTYIGKHVFGCSSLETITIPDSVEYIDGSAFTELMIRTFKITYSGTKAQWDEIFNKGANVMNCDIVVYCSDGTKMIPY